MALNKEAWLPVILEQYDRQPTFLNKATDLSAFVDNDKIHIPSAGADPDVLLDNTTYPIAVNQRTDVDNEKTLQTYDIENTLVRNIEQAELSYDKMTSVTRRHVQSLVNKQGSRSSWLFTPSSDASLTPLLRTTGADDGTSTRKLQESDVLALARRFDDFAPNQMRTLVLTVKDWYDLLETSTILRGQQERMGGNPGTITNAIFALYGFDIAIYNGENFFNKTTGAKLAYGAATDVNSRIASFAFVDSEVFRAVGNTDVFYKPKDLNPEERGDIFGLQQRFLAEPMRNGYIGAIVPDHIV